MVLLPFCSLLLTVVHPSCSPLCTPPAHRGAQLPAHRGAQPPAHRGAHSAPGRVPLGHSTPEESDNVRFNTGGERQCEINACFTEVYERFMPVLPRFMRDLCPFWQEYGRFMPVLARIWENMGITGVYTGITGVYKGITGVYTHPTYLVYAPLLPTWYMHSLYTLGIPPYPSTLGVYHVLHSVSSVSRNEALGSD